MLGTVFQQVFFPENLHESNIFRDKANLNAEDYPRTMYTFGKGCRRGRVKNRPRFNENKFYQSIKAANPQPIQII